MGSLTCLIEALITLAVLSLVLIVIYWAITRILAAWEIAIAPKVLILLQVIGVLLVVLVLLHMFAGGYCGWVRIPRA